MVKYCNIPQITRGFCLDLFTFKECNIFHCLCSKLQFKFIRFRLFFNNFEVIYRTRSNTVYKHGQLSCEVWQEVFPAAEGVGAVFVSTCSCTVCPACGVSSLSGSLLFQVNDR